MTHCLQHLKRSARTSLAALCLAVMAGCTSLMPVTDEQGRVYHCVGTARPIPPPNTWAKKLPLERFEYGEYVDTDRPTTGSSGYCNIMYLPKNAYLRYRVDGRVVEKHFDLSTLTPERVYKKTVEFYVDDDTVEVRLVTPVPGTWPIKEIVTKQ